MLQNAHLETSKTYIASEDLMKTVNIAMTLKKPLLVKGEPGTGKTMLAQAIADALGKKLLTWNIKSTTKAQDGLYTYDVVQRLYDSQFGGEVADVSQYIKYGKIGEAFLSEEQVILLIDEIDKADLEFPNDLLWEMDQMEFYVQETGENQWRQYFVADGIQTKIDGKYKVVAKVKASEAVTINVNMGWGWGQGESKGASVAIPGSTDFQVVEWTYEGIGGSSCNLVAQPATSTATIEWQSLVVYEWQKENQRPKVWQEWLTSDGNPVTLPDKSTAIPFPPATVANWMGNASKDWPTDATADGSYWKGDNVGLICAWGKTKGRNLGPNFAGTGEGFNPFPADIEEVDGNRVFVVHGAKADTEGDAAAWDN